MRCLSRVIQNLQSHRHYQSPVGCVLDHRVTRGNPPADIMRRFSPTVVKQRRLTTTFIGCPHNWTGAANNCFKYQLRKFLTSRYGRRIRFCTLIAPLLIGERISEYVDR